MAEGIAPSPRRPNLQITTEFPDPAMKGWLEKKRKFGSHKRYFVLENGMLAYYASASTDSFPLGFMSMKEVREIRYNPSQSKDGKKFELICYSRNFLLGAESKDVAIEWVRALETAKKVEEESLVNKKKEAGSPTTPKFLKGHWEADEAEGLAAYAENEFRLAFYKTALKRPHFMQTLMTDFRTEESIIRLLIQILLDPVQAPALWFALGDASSANLLAGESKSEDAAIAAFRPSLSTGAASEGDPTVFNDILNQRSRRSSGCARFNPECHKTSLDYRPRVPLQVSNLPDIHELANNAMGQFSLKNATASATVNKSGSRTPPASSHAPWIPSLRNALSPIQASRADDSSPSGSPSASPKPAITFTRAITPTAADLARLSISMSQSQSALTVEFPTRASSQSLMVPSKDPRRHTTLPNPKKKTNAKDSSLTMTLALPMPTTSPRPHSSGAMKETPPITPRSPMSPMPHSQSQTFKKSEVKCDLLVARRSTVSARTPTANSTIRPATFNSTSVGAEEAEIIRTGMESVDKGARSANFYLTSTGYATIERADKQNLYDWMTSEDFLTKLSLVFATNDYMAHRLALRVVWILLQRDAHHWKAHDLDKPKGSPRDLTFDDLNDECPECRFAADQFCNYVEQIHAKYCSGRNLNLQVNATVSSLLAILVLPIKDFNSDAHDPARFSITGRDVRNYGVWRVVFSSLSLAEFHTRRRALKDINGVLIHRPHNCESILAQEGWQQWVLPLLTDLPKELNNRLLEKTYQYTVNIFTLLHFHCFEHYIETFLAFEKVIKSSLVAPLQLKDDKIHIMRAFLLALMNKVRNQQHMFQNFDRCAWTNLRHLLRFVKAFLFLTPPRNVDADNAHLYADTEARYGLHYKHDCEADMKLIESTITLLETVKIDTVDAPPEHEFSSLVSPQERTSLKALKESDELAFFRDSYVFLPMVFSCADLMEQEVEELVKEFVNVDNKTPDARKKVFRAAQERHKEMVKLKEKYEKELSRQLSQRLERENAISSQVTSLLLLGPGESGKSTVFKQIKQLYDDKGYSDQDKIFYRRLIWQNCISSAKTVCKQSDVIGQQLPQAKVAAVDSRAFIEGLDDFAALTPEVAGHIRKLWEDKGFKLTLDLRANYQLAAGDSIPHYYNKIEEIGKFDYMPDESDVLRSRARTTGVIDLHVKIDGHPFKITDVGGQRGERKRWIHQFQDVTAVLYIAAISEYNQVIAEDEKTNRVEESLNLFEDICKISWFKHTPIILFLNKADLFAEKLPRFPLGDYFPAFNQVPKPTDSSSLYTLACKFLQHQFQIRGKDKDLYVHVTCATDTKQMKIILGAVKHFIIKESLGAIGLM